MTAAPTVLLAHALPPADSPDMQAALAALPLPFVRRWLQASVAQHTVRTTAEDLALPLEVALAESLGWQSPPGTWPWAARAASRHPPEANEAWAFITLCHWHIGNGQFTLLDPGPVSPSESQALLASMQPYFEEDGITLLPDVPGRWLARSALFDGLASASLARVQGLPIEPWLLGSTLPELTPALQTLRRLQNEMQMLLYQHPVNDARAIPLNSIWIEGCGRLDERTPLDTSAANSVTCIDDLSHPWLLRDAHAWARAWERLDAEVLPALLGPAGARVAWCGQRQARWWIHQPPGVWQRLQRHLRPLRPAEVLSCDT